MAKNEGTDTISVSDNKAEYVRRLISFVKLRTGIPVSPTTVYDEGFMHQLIRTSTTVLQNRQQYDKLAFIYE